MSTCRSCEVPTRALRCGARGCGGRVRRLSHGGDAGVRRDRHRCAAEPDLVHAFVRDGAATMPVDGGARFVRSSDGTGITLPATFGGVPATGTRLARDVRWRRWHGSNRDRSQARAALIRTPSRDAGTLTQPIARTFVAHAVMLSGPPFSLARATRRAHAAFKSEGFSSMMRRMSSLVTGPDKPSEHNM